MKIAFVILVIVTIALAVIVFGFVENVPPQAFTRSRMTVYSGSDLVFC
jgi:hypothetical protein